MYLDLGVVGDGRLAILVRDRHLEDTVVVLGHGRRIAVPIVEIANKVGTQGIGSPFTVYDIAIGLDNEAEFLKTLQALSVTAWHRDEQVTRPRKRFQAALGLVNCLDPFLGL